MGNKFKLSDMIPNAWFYKLKDMSKSRKRNVPLPPHHVMKNKVTSSPTISQRSHYFSIEPTKSGKLFNTPIHNKKDYDIDIPFNDSPRRSSKRRTRRKTVYKPSKPIQVKSPDYDLSSNESSFEDDLQFHHEYAYSESDYDDGFSVPDLFNGVASNTSCRVSSSTNDIIIDMNNESFQGEFDAISQLGLAPILTKSAKFDDKIIEVTEFRSSSESDELLIDQIDQDRSFSIKEEISRSQSSRKSNQIARKPFDYSIKEEVTEFRSSTESDELLIDQNQSQSFSIKDERSRSQRRRKSNQIARNPFDYSIKEEVTEVQSSTESDELLIDQNRSQSFSIKEESSRSQRRRKTSHIGLAPILTKSAKFDDKLIEVNEFRTSSESDELLIDQIDQDRSFSIKEESSRSQRRRKSNQIARKPSTNSNGIRLRVNSPKLVASKKIQACARKSVSVSKGSKNAGFPDGFAVVKSSMDPISDFKESMVEMIVENNIRASKDLEDLLACYLSLNSSEYHDLIVKAFEQIWYDMAHLRM